MFILQTTIAVLVSFLAIIAYESTLSILGSRRRRRSNGKSIFNQNIKTKIIKEDSSLSSKESTSWSTAATVADQDLNVYKELFHKLHNLEDFPEIIPRCGDLLVSLLSETLTDAFEDTNENILSLSRFSRPELERFLATNHASVTEAWEGYLVKRTLGGPREMFPTVDAAKWWLKQAAPVKYVDGAWLGHINKITTPFALRDITKNAWQIMSEELGDGDLSKNHVHLYRELMQQINAGLPDADSADFIHPRHGLNETRVWKAAVAQLLISLFPQDFLPEMLGFNMAYETLPLHLMKTTKELNELGLNSYYFVLHISIDNSDTGHAAMGMATVADYIEQVAAEQGDEAAQRAWKRVQAGYILAEGLPTTPELPHQKHSSRVSFPRNDSEAAVVEIFKAKTRVAHKIHCNSRLKIGRHTLVEWLDPEPFQNPEWQRAFMDDLSNRKPWVIKGNSEQSRLCRELSWEGKMFGSFTESEVEAVKRWIDSLGVKPRAPNQQIYYDFVSRQRISFTKYLEQRPNQLYYPVIKSCKNPQPLPLNMSQSTVHSSEKSLNVSFDIHPADALRILPLWLTANCLLESIVNVPVRVSDKPGSAIVKILRAQYGYDTEGPGVAGTDELRRTNEGKAIGLVQIALDMHCSLKETAVKPRCLDDVFTSAPATVSACCSRLLDLSMRPIQYREVLIGLTWAFMEVHELLAACSGDWLATASLVALRGIATRERRNLLTCVDELRNDEQHMAAFWSGCETGRDMVRGLLEDRDSVY